ncbi:MAG TPA: endonuclease/exonuclease/phosphatase family protein [Jatrophihabitans sp.]|nr:endonuclease/exonuclease/phosphatase family protein [Jatrophihabitans sp.]
MPTLTVLSYNVRSLRDDRDAVARVIRDARPDVAIVQEAPRFLRWRSTCAALARRSGLLWEAGGRVAGANLILTTLAVRSLARYEVPFADRPRLHHRGAAVAVLELAGCRFAVAGTHLDLIEAPRLAHLDELAAFAESRLGGVPLVVGGDLNAAPGSATWQRCARFGPDAFAAAGAGDGFTYSAARPVRRIDAVFADARLRPVHAEVLDSPDVRAGSDHRPLLVRFEL